MTPDQIARPRALAEESEQGDLIRDLCDTIEHLKDCE